MKISPYFQKLTNKVVGFERKYNSKKQARKSAKSRPKEYPGSIPSINNSFTVGEAIKALKKLPKNETMWVRYVTSNNNLGMTGCGYIGYINTPMFGCEDSVWIPVFQPLSPEREEVNRKLSSKNK